MIPLDEMFRIDKSIDPESRINGAQGLRAEGNGG